jgi:hypothetical protein
MKHVVAHVAFPGDIGAVRDGEFRFTGGAPPGGFVHRLAPYGHGNGPGES